MKKYRKLPVVIEAVQFTGENIEEVKEFLGGELKHGYTWYFSDSWDPMIQTLEGDHKVSLGDFVIKGVKGEFYPCKPDIFAATYEEVAP